MPISRVKFLITFVLISIAGCGETMHEFDTEKEYQNCLPKLLQVDDIGWSAFLDQWNNQVLFWVKKTVLRFGIYPESPDRSSESWKKYLEESEFDNKYIALRVGDIDFPPTNDHEKEVVNTRMELHWSYLQEWQRKYKERGIQWENDHSHFTDSENLIIYNNSLKFEPADEAAISNKENELGITLPETYKEFLKVSNGWVLDKLMLSPVEDISWTFSAEQASYIFWSEMLWDERYPNLKPGDPLPKELREHLGNYYEQYEFEQTGLLISKYFDRDYLVFNPHKLTPNGDWLGWNDSADGDYRSTYAGTPLKPFKSMMEDYYRCDVARRCVTYKELEHIRG
jgi:hypothetical protein